MHDKLSKPKTQKMYYHTSILHTHPKKHYMKPYMVIFL